MGFRGQNCSMDCPGIFLNSYSFLFFSVLRLECQWGLARINEECEYILARIALLIENCSIQVCVCMYICIIGYMYIFVYMYICVLLDICICMYI